jgi:hypothetical protein
MRTTNNNASFPARIDAQFNPTNKAMNQNQYTPKERIFQYKCSFCQRELPNGGWRFAGFGACPPHLKLAETIVDALRRHRARYFNSNFTEVK